MIVENVFEKIIYPQLKEYVEKKSIYHPQITKRFPQESKIFPIVPIKLLPVKNKYNNLSYNEETYSFGISIEIYTIDLNIEGKKVSKRTICNEISNTIIEYFKNNFHVTINHQLDVPNIDSNVQRNIVTIEGILDTKFGQDKLVIYPK